MNLLPVETFAAEIKDKIEANNVVIICGSTGCGKSTVIPRILLKSNIPRKKLLAVTQPRRVAASSLAVKVAEDMGSEVGKLVGYKFRFEDVTSDSTRLVYITDGMLLKEYANDRLLSKYGCIILDEVHERSIATDILIWCIREVLRVRKKFKLVLMSATMNVEPLKEYFSAQAYFIPGRPNKVELFYCEQIDLNDKDHVGYAVQTVVQLHETEPLEHSFLVFLTGQDEIEFACKWIQDKLKGTREFHVIPFYAQRRKEDVDDIFKVYENSRKIIVATNIAETSITIPDVRVVIDSGKCKQKRYVHDCQYSILEICPISQAQAIQRTGRAGRCADGKCYRLYSRAAFDGLQPQTTPEILRSSLSEVLFNLLGAGIKRPTDVTFLDNPSEAEWYVALDELIALELIQARLGNEVYAIKRYFELEMNQKLSLNFQLTEMGEFMKWFPLAPMLLRFLYKAWKLGCLHGALTICAFCSCEDVALPLETMTGDEKTEHDKAMKFFDSPPLEGDHRRLVSMFRHYKKLESKNAKKQWCQNTGFSYRRFEEVFQVRKQLWSACHKMNMTPDNNPYSDESMKNAITQSFYLNTCVYASSSSSYMTTASNRREKLLIHPSSSLYRGFPSTVVYTELVRTKKLYMRNVTPVNRNAIEPILIDLKRPIRPFGNGNVDSKLLPKGSFIDNDLQRF